MKKLTLLTSLLLLLLEGGCATSPELLGIPPTEWQGYSKTQRTQLLQDYQQVKATQDKTFAQNAASTANTISVNIQGGKVIMPPFTDLQEYLPVIFTIQNGQCKRVPIYQASQQQKIDLNACYQNNVLYLDPSRYDVSKEKGSLIFNAIPFWQHGFTYHNVSSSGYARLTQVEITINTIHE